MSYNNKIVILGRTGHLGKFLYRKFQTIDRELITLGRNEIRKMLDGGFEDSEFKNCDFVNAAAIVGNDNISAFGKEEVINVNSILPAIIAKICAINNTRLIHISSNSVFDGSSLRYRRTCDEPCSENLYGSSKLTAEKNILSILDPKNSLIIRSPQQYSNDLNNPRNCLMGIYYQCLNKNEIIITRNEMFSIASCRQISNIIFNLFLNNQSGLFHLCEKEEYNWLDIAYKLAKSLSISNKLKIIEGYRNNSIINNTLVPSSNCSLNNEINSIIENL